jgi:hypothetical protein
MKIQRFIIGMILILIMVNCAQNNKYQKFKKFQDEVSSEVFKTFPIISKDDISASYLQIINYPSGYSSLGYSGIFLVYKYDIPQYQKKIERLEKNSRIKYYYKDSCNILIPNNENSNRKCEMERIPIPNISDETIGIDSLISKNNSLFYIFDSGNGFFMKNKENYPKWNQYVVKNGFSCGAVSNYEKKTIIYWMIIW